MTYDSKSGIQIMTYGSSYGIQIMMYGRLTVIVGCYLLIEIPDFLSNK
jgi:hypothetical protein